MGEGDGGKNQRHIYCFKKELVGQSDKFDIGYALLYYFLYRFSSSITIEKLSLTYTEKEAKGLQQIEE